MFSFLILVILAMVFVYFALSRYYNYWKNRKVPSLPTSFIFGNFKECLSLKKTFGQVYDEIYKSHPHLPYVGYYNMRDPGLLIRDPDLIEEVLVKQFKNFHDNEMVVKNEADDPLGARNPSLARGDRWKVHRNRLTPGLTPKQIESMFPTFAKNGDNLVEYLNQNEKSCVEAKDLALKYTCDCIATCAFGLEANSFKNQNSEFREMGKSLLSPSLFHAIRILLLLIVPKLAKILKMKFIIDEAGNYFRSIIAQTVKYRKDKMVVRNDFLDLMINLKEKHSDGEITDDDITGYCIAVFMDGFETSGITINFILYDLGTNIHIQNQLRDYIKKFLAESPEGLTYKSLQEMKLLDQVISETLRLHPPALFLTRQCTQEYNFPSLGNPEQKLKVERGVKIAISIYSLHMDEKYFPNPEKYDPERFSENNNESIQKNTYLPFGGGPRMCIGFKLAMAQIKTVIVKLLLNFEIRVNDKTKTPLEFDPLYPFNSAKGGIWVDFYAINES